jgi:hypothetical protein
MLFEIDQNGVWEFITFLDEGKGTAVEPISDTLVRQSIVAFGLQSLSY